MEIFFTILIMTLVVSLSGVVTRVMPFQIPLPLMQIAIGALLAWPTFGLHVEFDPELFLVLFIPPLLFADGWKTPTREFLEHGREIFGLALALVVVTVVGIGFLIYWVVPGIPLIPAFALAAVLSPTDAVALSGIVGEGRIPKKIMGILQGPLRKKSSIGGFTPSAQLTSLWVWDFRRPICRRLRRHSRNTSSEAALLLCIKTGRFQSLSVMCKCSPRGMQQFLRTLIKSGDIRRLTS